MGTSNLQLSQVEEVGDLETHSLGLAQGGEDASSWAEPLTASRQTVPDQVKAGPCWGRGNTFLGGRPHIWGWSTSRAQGESRGTRAGAPRVAPAPTEGRAPRVAPASSLFAHHLLWPRWAFSAASFFSSCREQGLLSSCGAWGPHCSGFCSEAQSRGCTGSAAAPAGPALAAPELWRTGSAAGTLGLSRSVACGTFPGQGSSPRPLHGQADSSHCAAREAQQPPSKEDGIHSLAVRAASHQLLTPRVHKETQEGCGCEY